MARILGPYTPHAYAVAGTGTTWWNPTDAYTENGMTASSMMSYALGLTTQQLWLTDFRVPAYPADWHGTAGVVVKVKCAEGSSGEPVRDTLVQLIIDGALQGTNAADSTELPTVLTWLEYGDPDDYSYWGIGNLHDKMLESDFGVAIAYDHPIHTPPCYGATVSVDAVSLYIYESECLIPTWIAQPAGHMIVGAHLMSLGV